MDNNQPSKLSGQAHQVIGGAVEGVGNAMNKAGYDGSDWVTSGKQEQAEGKGEENAAEAQAAQQGQSEGDSKA